jgi:hypothetical protein
MSIVLVGSTSGSCTLQEQAVAGNTTLTLPTFNGTVGLLVSGTAVASTSGTSIDFTGIPAGVRRITVIFQGVSLSGTSTPLIQIGSGSISNSGYVSISGQAYIGGAVVGFFTSAIGFVIANNSAANTVYGSYVFTLISNNTWVGSSSMNGTSALNMILTSSGTSPNLSGALDRIRITATNGTDTFDAGSINILYE